MRTLAATYLYSNVDHIRILFDLCLTLVAFFCIHGVYNCLVQMLQIKFITVSFQTVLKIFVILSALLETKVLILGLDEML